MNRTQHDSVCDTKSGNILLKAGVHQGFVLFPLLFNLYVNDLAKTLSGCEIYQYADDTLLIPRQLNLCSALALLQDNAMHLMGWFDANLNKNNMNKTIKDVFQQSFETQKP